jgi:hypothetical protein
VIAILSRLSRKNQWDFAHCSSLTAFGAKLRDKEQITLASGSTTLHCIKRCRGTMINQPDSRKKRDANAANGTPRMMAIAKNGKPSFEFIVREY